MRRLYTNAADVLPPELLAQVQKIWPGGYMWVPIPGNGRQKLAVTLIQSGMKACEIANVTGLTLSRIYQIGRTLGEANPYRKGSFARNAPVRPK